MHPATMLSFDQELRKIAAKQSSGEDKEYNRMAKGHGRLGAAVGGAQGALVGAGAGSKHGIKGAIAGGLGDGLTGAGIGYGGGRLHNWLAGKVAPKRGKKKESGY